jgi:hypothetical protein
MNDYSQSVKAFSQNLHELVDTNRAVLAKPQLSPLPGWLGLSSYHWQIAPLRAHLAQPVNRGLRLGAKVPGPLVAPLKPSTDDREIADRVLDDKLLALHIGKGRAESGLPAVQIPAEHSDESVENGPVDSIAG